MRSATGSPARRSPRMTGRSPAATRPTLKLADGRLRGPGRCRRDLAPRWHGWALAPSRNTPRTSRTAPRRTASPSSTGQGADHAAARATSSTASPSGPSWSRSGSTPARARSACPRIVGAFAAGRIINPRTARSQYLGGMIWGVGSALHEATEIDRRYARYVNDNLAEYLIAGERRHRAGRGHPGAGGGHRVNPAGIKGIGELATSARRRRSPTRSITRPASGCATLPIRIEDLV